MHISPQVSIPISIEQGSIYHYRIETKNKDGSNYSGERFFVVLNSNPKTDTVLVMATMTTKIKSVEQHIVNIGANADSIVRIAQSDFSALSSDTAINCNQVYEVSLSELIEKIGSGGKIFTQKLPKNKMDAIISAVVQSKQIATEHKRMVI